MTSISIYSMSIISKSNFFYVFYIYIYIYLSKTSSRVLCCSVCCSLEQTGHLFLRWRSQSFFLFHIHSPSLAGK